MTELDPDETKPRREHKRYAHFKTVCISLYTSDLADLDAKVAELKRRGLVRASRSLVIRLAVGKLDADALAAAIGGAP